MTLISMTVETSAVTSLILLLLDRYLVIALITHAKYHLILFTLCCITVAITAVVTIVVWYWCHWVALYCDHLNR
jgi:hypothetical protein